MDIRYNIKYMRNDTLTELEEYLSDVSYHDLKKKMFFKINSTRTDVEVSNDEGRMVHIPMDEFVDRTWRKLLIFFKFHNITEDDINKPIPNDLDKLISKTTK